MLWVIGIYLFVGLLMAGWVFLSQLDEMGGFLEVATCLMSNLLFWPLILVLAIAAGKFRRD